MAVTKTHPIKSTLKAAIDYILNPEKTDGKLLASSFGCGLETADIEFAWTREAAGDRGTHLGRHLIQSFAVGETTPEEAHKIGMELAQAVLGGKYEFVLTTHVDKEHLHNHLIFNAVSFVDYKKYHSNKQSYHFIRRTSDRICKEHGLSVVVPGQDKGKSYAEYTAEKQGRSYKAKLKTAIDTGCWAKTGSAALRAFCSSWRSMAAMSGLLSSSITVVDGEGVWADCFLAGAAGVSGAVSVSVCSLKDASGAGSAGGSDFVGAAGVAGADFPSCGVSEDVSVLSSGCCAAGGTVAAAKGLSPSSSLPRSVKIPPNRYSSWDDSPPGKLNRFSFIVTVSFPKRWIWAQKSRSNPPGKGLLRFSRLCRI